MWLSHKRTWKRGIGSTKEYIRS